MSQALRLVKEIREEHRDGGTQQVVCSYAGHIPPADFEAIRQELIRCRGRGDVRNEGKWVNGALRKRFSEGGGMSERSALSMLDPDSDAEPPLRRPRAPSRRQPGRRNRTPQPGTSDLSR